MQIQRLILLLIITIWLTACGQNEPTVVETAVPATATTAANPRAIDTPTPSLPPTWTPGISPNAPSSGGGSTTTTTTTTTNPSGVAVRDTYTIQPGDSLGKIAIQFDVSLDALIRANNITDPDHIEVGVELIIPEE